MRLNFLKPVAIIAIFSVICMYRAYYSFSGGHDTIIHGLWTKNFANILHDGIIHPRFANKLNMGFGSYVFFFYPPVSLYLDSIFSFLGRDQNFYFDTINASANLAFFVSAITCYMWLKTRAEPKIAMVCALIYMTLPIHLVLDFYITGVISQLWCYAWFPLIMLGSEKIAKNEKSGFYILSISAALLILTNIPMTIIFPPFAFIYGMIQLKNLKQSALLISAWLVACLLAAFYVWPMMEYKNLVNIDLHWSGPRALKFDDFFLDQKLFSNDISQLHRFITFLCFILTIMFSGLFITMMKRGRMKIFLALTISVCVFMCFSISKPVWEVLPLLQKVQFPRRLLIIQTIIIPLAATYLAKDRLKAIVVCNLIFLFMIVSTNETAVMSPRVYKIQQDIFMHNMEYFPNYFPSKDVIPYFYSDYPFRPDIANYPKVQSVAQIKILKWESGDIELKASGKRNDEIIIRQFWFPAWQAHISGQKIKVLADEKLKILKIILPRDVENETLAVTLEKLPAEIYGLWISLITLLTLLGSLVIKKCRALKQ